MRFPRATHPICHCKTEAEAEEVKEAIEKRFEQCGLELNPRKTQIVYCKDERRNKDYPRRKFDFLGFTFRPRKVKGKNGLFIGFNPAVSNKAKRKMNQQIRSWELHLRTNWSLEDLAAYCNPVIGGWFNYYGSYYHSALDDVVRQMDLRLGKWAERKYKRFRGHSGRAIKWVRGVRGREPKLFAHWQLYPRTAGL